MCVCVYVCPSVRPSAAAVCVRLPVCLSARRCVCVSLCLYVCLVCVCVCLCVCLSVCRLPKIEITYFGQLILFLYLFVLYIIGNMVYLC